MTVKAVIHLKLSARIAILAIAVILSACSGKPKIDTRHPPNILLVVLDAARADHFSSYGYGRPTTPNLDQMAQEGIRYSRAVSTSSWTLPAHASLFTGLLPEEHGARNQHAWLIDRIPTLAELLRQKGYRTGCFTNNPIIDRVHNLVRGFEAVERVWADSAISTEVRPHNTEYTNTLVHSFTRSGSNRPFFAFINYMDVHQPYEAPEPYRSMYLEAGQEITARVDSACRYAELLNDGKIVLNEKEKTALRDIYDGCLTYLDAQIGRLVQDLREGGIYDSTLVIVTSDHGEIFGEYGRYGHGDLLNRPLIHIPLIVRYPTLFPSPGVRRELVSIADIFHSLADLLGLQGMAATGAPMRNIFSKNIEQAACLSSFTLGRVPPEMMKYRHDTHSVWTPQDRHYILRKEEAVECFDLAADFGELHNLCPAQVSPGEVASVIEEAGKSLVGFQETDQDLRVTGELKVDPEVERAMRALGYLGGARDLAGNAKLPIMQDHPHVMEHFQSGNFFISLDSLNAAEVEFRKALQMSQGNNNIRKRLSLVLFREKNYEEVLRILSPAVHSVADDPEMFLFYGLALKETGKIDSALEYLRKASDLEPRGLPAALNATEILLYNHRFAEAEVYARRVLVNHYGNLPVLLNVIAFNLKYGNPEGARNLLIDELKIARSGTVYAILTIVYRTMGQESEAGKCRDLAARLGITGARFDQIDKQIAALQ